MIKIVCTKDHNILRPSTQWAEETLAKIPNGEVMIQITQPRNIQFHKLFFAMINLAYKHQEHYETPEALLTALKIALGHCDTLICNEGNIAYIPKSISFSKMDELEFRNFFDHAADLICRRMLNGTETESFRNELESMLS